jgi:hypothetical protein
VGLGLLVHDGSHAHRLLDERGRRPRLARGRGTPHYRGSDEEEVDNVMAISPASRPFWMTNNKPTFVYDWQHRTIDGKLDFFIKVGPLHKRLTYNEPRDENERMEIIRRLFAEYRELVTANKVREQLRS